MNRRNLLIGGASLAAGFLSQKPGPSPSAEDPDRVTVYVLTFGRMPDDLPKMERSIEVVTEQASKHGFQLCGIHMEPCEPVRLMYRKTIPRDEAFRVRSEFANHKGPLAEAFDYIVSLTIES